MKFNPKELSEFIDTIMSPGNSGFRQSVRRDGAIRCRRAGDGSYVDEACWIDPETAEQYFRPRSLIYAKAIHYHCLYAPDGAQITWANWCDKTVGTIVDCAFGCAYRNPKDEK